MKMNLIFATLLFIGIGSYAQSDSSSDDNKTQIAAGILFNTNQSYAGRTDSLKLPVLIPEINLTFPKGFFLNAKGYLNLSQHTTSFDGISLEPGYQFSKKNWNGSFSVIKNFISDSSNLIIAPVNASLEFYLNKETKILSPFIGWEYSFSGEGNDFILYGGLSKDIVFTKDDSKTSVDVNPAASLTAGSQNFYYSYLKSFSSHGSSKRGGNGRGRGNGGTSTTTTTTQVVEQQSKTFSLLASEIELPLTISSGKLKWTTTPALETPVNLVGSSTAGAQNSSSFFYVTTELLFNF